MCDKPFAEEHLSASKDDAVSVLLSEISKGEASLSEGTVCEEDLAAEFGVKL